MSEQVQTAWQEQKAIGADDVIAAMMSMVGHSAALDEKRVELLKQLTRQILTGNEERQ